MATYPCRNCGSLVSLDEEALELYQSAGFYTRGLPLRKCAYCIGKRVAAERKHELPRRIDASYPYGAITAMPGNTWTDWDWIEALARPLPRPGFDPDSPFARLSDLELRTLQAEVEALVSFIAEWRAGGRASRPEVTGPYFGRPLLRVGAQAFFAGSSADPNAIEASYDEWKADKTPKGWMLAAWTVCRMGFAMVASGVGADSVLAVLEREVHGESER